MSGTPDPTGAFPTVEPGGKIVAALDYWVLVPKQSEQNVTGVVADAFIESTPQGSAIDTKLLSNYAGQVTINGRTGYQRAGPFTTLAAAQAYLKVGAQNAASPIPGVAITPGGGLTGALPSPIAAVAAFLAKLGQAALWLRVGEVALGLVLVAVGVAKLVPAFTPAQMIAKRVGAAA